MKPLVFLAAAAAMLGTTPAVAKKAKLPPYPYALRCSALTNAAMRNAGADSPQHMKYFDDALFWGLALSDSARKAGLSAPKFEAEAEAASLAAQAQLAGGDARTAADLARCQREVPPLKRKKR